MNIKRFLLSIFSGTLVYVAVSFCCGESGLWAKSQLEKQKEELVINIKNIQTINDDLSLQKKALNIDFDVIASYAKSLGFIQDNEKIVKISGIPSRTPLHPNIGKKYLKREIQYIPEWICKCLGTVVFLLTFITLLLSGMSRKTARKYSIQEVFNESCT